MKFAEPSVSHSRSGRKPSPAWCGIARRACDTSAPGSAPSLAADQFARYRTVGYAGFRAAECILVGVENQTHGHAALSCREQVPPPPSGRRYRTWRCRWSRHWLAPRCARAAPRGWRLRSTREMAAARPAAASSAAAGAAVIRARPASPKSARCSSSLASSGSSAGPRTFIATFEWALLASCGFAEPRCPRGRRCHRRPGSPCGDSALKLTSRAQAPAA